MYAVTHVRRDATCTVIQAVGSTENVPHRRLYPGNRKQAVARTEADASGQGSQMIVTRVLMQILMRGLLSAICSASLGS